MLYSVPEVCTGVRAARKALDSGRETAHPGTALGSPENSWQGEEGCGSPAAPNSPLPLNRLDFKVALVPVTSPSASCSDLSFAT